MGEIMDREYRFQATAERGRWEPPADYRVDGVPCSCFELVDGEHDPMCDVGRENWFWDEVDRAMEMSK